MSASITKATSSKTDETLSQSYHQKEIIMTTKLSRLYDTDDDAQRVVADLKRAGIPDDDISLIANSGDGSETMADTSEATSTGAGLGAVVGGGAGLLAGLGVMAIPGVGPIVAAGWMASTLTGIVAGAASGAAAGGIVGALTDSGLDERDAHVYAESIRRGGSMVIVKTTDMNQAVAESILDGHSSVYLPDRRSAYESDGWDGFDEKRGPYVPGATRPWLRDGSRPM
jgi:uncharacterized membrane protein